MDRTPTTKTPGGAPDAAAIRAQAAGWPNSGVPSRWHLLRFDPSTAALARAELLAALERTGRPAMLVTPNPMGTRALPPDTPRLAVVRWPSERTSADAALEIADAMGARLWAMAASLAPMAEPRPRDYLRRGDVAYSQRGDVQDSEALLEPDAGRLALAWADRGARVDQTDGFLWPLHLGRAAAVSPGDLAAMRRELREAAADLEKRLGRPPAFAELDRRVRNIPELDDALGGRLAAWAAAMLAAGAAGAPPRE